MSRLAEASQQLRECYRHEKQGPGVEVQADESTRYTSRWFDYIVRQGGPKEQFGRWFVVEGAWILDKEVCCY